jgi:rhamnosyltransferase
MALAAAAGVTILLSTFNGARYLAEQVKSLQRQTFTDWNLLVRDDGSSDGTADLLETLGAAEPRMTIVRDGRGNLGPEQSFGALMKVALQGGAEYFAFSDQDDVWQPDKLEQELQVLRGREAALDPGVPLLVHSDLAVVDEDLRLIHPSFLGSQRLRAGAAPLPQLLTQNFVTGCSIVANHPLVRAALPLEDAVMHDWWLALCAAALGEILYCPRATVLYRQHGQNAAGSRWWGRAVLDAVLHPILWWRRSSAVLSATVAQACALARRIEREAPGGGSSAGALAVVRDFCCAFSSGSGGIDRLRTVWRHGVRPRSTLGYPLFFYVRVMLWPAEGRPSCGVDG